MILTLRTDKPESEIGLYLDQAQLTYETWQAHRQLAETLHQKIHDMLISKNVDFKDLSAIVCYQGPGSFTGLRIGISVANALAHSLNIPIVGEEGEVSWQDRGMERLKSSQNDKIVLPIYGAPVHITQSRK
ncbi:MAG: tRNA (adenosine(37)-N6)-threonylcarbamoyltransferase complex dimerization subunit type 1 TsaB [bacterium]|nr:tRNA (adenosine(37)-N6)-threonylcarbamoyltransferase complex dimerization subunit type 1 TsaB [bacterium]